jgi:hypothetical protein
VLVGLLEADLRIEGISGASGRAERGRARLGMAAASAPVRVQGPRSIRHGRCSSTCARGWKPADAWLGRHRGQRSTTAAAAASIMSAAPHRAG